MKQKTNSSAQTRVKHATHKASYIQVFHKLRDAEANVWLVSFAVLIIVFVLGALVSLASYGRLQYARIHADQQAASGTVLLSCPATGDQNKPIQCAVAFSGQTTSGGGSSVYQCSFDWGDGTVSAGRLCSSSAQHTYAFYGSFTITATVSAFGLSPGAATSTTTKAIVIQHDPLAVLTANLTADQPPVYARIANPTLYYEFARIELKNPTASAATDVSANGMVLGFRKESLTNPGPTGARLINAKTYDVFTGGCGGTLVGAATPIGRFPSLALVSGQVGYLNLQGKTKSPFVLHAGQSKVLSLCQKGLQMLALVKSTSNSSTECVKASMGLVAVNNGTKSLMDGHGIVWGHDRLFGPEDKCRPFLR